MKTASLECQIAREQLKRYLGGSKLSPELVRGLERHLAICPDCLASARQGRKPEGERDAKSNANSKTRKMPGFALIDTAKAAVGKPMANKKQSNMRTMILGGMLTLTLIAMGAISRNPEGMFGKRVMTAEAKPVPVLQESAPAPMIEEPMKGAPMPMVAGEVPMEESPARAASEAEAVKPVAETPEAPAPAPRNKPISKRTTAKSPAKKPVRRSSPPAQPSPKPKSDTGSIRVYDASGRPVNPR